MTVVCPPCLYEMCKQWFELKGFKIIHEPRLNNDEICVYDENGKLTRYKVEEAK
jgi:hypothetical protein